MTLFHQKPQKPGRRYSSPPNKKHPWKAGLSRRKLIISGRESITDMESEWKLPEPRRELCG